MTSPVQKRILIEYHLNYAVDAYTEPLPDTEHAVKVEAYMDNAVDGGVEGYTEYAGVSADKDTVDAYPGHAVGAYTEHVVEVMAYTEHAVEGYTEGVRKGSEGYTENVGVSDINICMEKAENFILREEQAESFMAEVVSQPTTKVEVVIFDDVVQCEPVKSARVVDREDKRYELVKSARMEDREDSSDYGNGGMEEVLAEQLTEQLEVFPPTRELRGGRVEGRDEVHREGAEGQQVQEGVLGGQEEEVSEDAGDPHLSTQVSPVYWIARSATNL